MAFPENYEVAGNEVRKITDRPRVAGTKFPFPPNNPPSTKRANYIASHFPAVRIGSRPNGANVYIQLRMVPAATKGGIVLPSEVRDFNEQQTCLGLVLAIGAAAFCDRNTGKLWPEGAWYEVGDLVMVRRHQGRRFALGVPGTEDRVVIAVVNDYDADSTIDRDFDDLENLYDQII